MSGVVAASGFRHGVVLPPRPVPRTFAEPVGVFGVAVPSRPAGGWQSASGGVARSRDEADQAAVGEALERYAAHVCELPLRQRHELDDRTILELEDFSLYSADQRADPAFPHRSLYDGERMYTNVFALADNREAWVPAELIGLAHEKAAVATSSGLAAGRTGLEALMRALQELIERDALMTTWLHGVPARQVGLAVRYVDEVSALGGSVDCFDVTPAFSPHPVAIVAGQLPLAGVRRYAIGAACRASWDAAVEKAYLEWLQGVSFVGLYRGYHPTLAFPTPGDVRTFEDHAVYYSVHPERWARLPLLQGESSPRPPDGPDSLEALAAALEDAGVRVFYRELTTSDVRQAGALVVRALSPDLAPIHCDERWPFLGGAVPDVRRRYRWVGERDLCFPNPSPHPLG